MQPIGRCAPRPLFEKYSIAAATRTLCDYPAPHVHKDIISIAILGVCSLAVPGCLNRRGKYLHRHRERLAHVANPRVLHRLIIIH